MPQGLNKDKVRPRIAALNARKPAAVSADDFCYSPDEPLRLIDPEKTGLTGLVQRRASKERNHPERFRLSDVEGAVSVPHVFESLVERKSGNHFRLRLRVGVVRVLRRAKLPKLRFTHATGT